MKQLLLGLLVTIWLIQPAWASEEIGRQEDTPSSSGHVLMPMGSVRQDTIGSTTDTDGDYQHLKSTSTGRLYTSTAVDTALPTGANTIGNVGLVTGSATIGNVGLNAGTNNIGDVDVVSAIPGTGATSLGKAEDNAHVNADTGVFVLGVRHDTSTTGLGVDGDYAALGLNASGELYVAANTEMPAAATLADNTANPTVPGVAAFLMCFDGTTWDRCQPGITDIDDNSVAFSQTTSLLIGLNHKSDGSSWIRERIYLEDVAAAGHDGGQVTIMGTVRQDTPASNTGTDGDYSYLKVDSVGRLWINCGTGCSGGTQFAEDLAHTTGDVGTIALVRRSDTAASSSTTDGDYSTLNTDSVGRLWVNPGFVVEDVAASGHDAGNMIVLGTVRQDTPAGSTSTDGDYANLKTDSVGRLWVNCGTGCSGGTQYVEDDAAAATPTLTMAGAVRQDTLSSSTSTDGDNAFLKVTAAGRLYVSSTIDAAIPAGTNNIGDVDVLTMPGTGTEDEAETAGGTLIMAGSVRRDTPTASSNGNGDNSTLNTNALGALYTQNIVGTTGGASVCAVQSAASTNANNCKGSAGNLYGVEVVNTTATVYYLRLYNLATSPTCSSATGFIRSIPIPSNSTSGAGIANWYTGGEAYGTGLGFCLTGGGSSTDNTNAATGVYIALHYK